MIRCKDCRNYSRNDGGQFPLRYDDDEPGRCTLAETEGGVAIVPKSLAYAEDAERYHAELRVQPTFGCVQGRKR